MARDKTTFEHYGTEFQKRIIAEIISDKRFAESILPILSPGYFKGNIHLSLLVAEIVNAFKDEVILDYETLQNRLLNHVITENEKDREEVLALITDIRAITLNDSEYTQETAMLFCKQQEMSKTITDIKKIIDRGNIEEFPKCEELIRKALELGGNKDNGVHLLDSIDSVLEDDFRKPISTGIDGLDECMDGGLSKGELAVILAATGVGKTTLVTKLAQAAYKEGKVVVQIFFEDTIKIIQRKHLACHTGIALNDLSSRKEEVKAAKVTLTEEHTGGKLIMKRFPSGTTTIPMIKQYLRKLTVSGIKPDMILLDYIDCVQSTRHSDDISTSEGQTMREFESLISEIDVAGWVCTQANRSAVTSDIVEANQMGGSFKKAQIGHFIMSIAKKLDQRDEGTASIAILKSRFGKDGITFPDSIFNNATMHIELKSNSGLNFGGMMNKKKEDEQNRVNLALRTRQAVNKVNENKEKEI